MPKALLFSDLHIHSHKDRIDRLEDCLQVLEWVFETAEKEDCKYIFFLGDLFHERSKIDVMNYLKTFEVFMKHLLSKRNEREVYLLVGNHDMYHREKWDINSVKPLSAIPNVRIIDKPTTTVIEGRTIDWMPHTENPVVDLEAFKEGKKKREILFGHMAVDGAILNTMYGTRSDVLVEYDQDMVRVSQDIFATWKMTRLGHYHGYQKLANNAEYLGSPLQLTFGEAFQKKHVTILDLATLEETKIENTFSPKHLIVTEKEVDEEVYDLNKSFVRVMVDEVSQIDLFEIKKKIQANNKVLSLDITERESRSKEDEQILEEVRTAALTDIFSLMKEWMKDKGIPEGMDEEKLFRFGEICVSYHDKNTSEVA